MFTIEDINAEASKVKSGAEFPQFAQALKKMGVTRNDVYVKDGLSIYFDDAGKSVQSSPEGYPELNVNPESSVEKLKHALEIHQKGESDYFNFCKQAADAGVEKWIIDTEQQSCKYLDSEQNILLEEKIPSI